MSNFRIARGIVGAAMLAAVSAHSAVSAADSYTLTDLGVLPGGGFSFGLGINTAGQITGTSDAADAAGFGQRGMLVSGTGMINLGLPPVPFVLSSAAPALNDTGQIIVNGYNGAFHAFIWSAGSFTDLTTLPNAIYSAAHGINNDGVVVGGVVLQLGGGSFPNHAFVYEGGQMVDLDPLFGGNYSDATDINESGTIVGDARFAGSSTIHGFMRHNGVVTNLGPSPNITSEASAINSSGQIVGGAYFDGLHERPMMYVGGRMIDLGLLPDAIAGTATDINDAGVIVGSFDMPGAYGVDRAFVYSNGVMRSLTDLLPPGSNWIIEDANGINSAGTIVATARNPQGHRRAVTLTPAPANPADLNGDGIIDTLDLGALLASWTLPPATACSGAACGADLNGDGAVNALDLGMLLAGWGPSNWSRPGLCCVPPPPPRRIFDLREGGQGRGEVTANIAPPIAASIVSCTLHARAMKRGTRCSMVATCGMATSSWPCDATPAHGHVCLLRGPRRSSSGTCADGATGIAATPILILRLERARRPASSVRQLHGQQRDPDLPTGPGQPWRAVDHATKGSPGRMSDKSGWYRS